MKRIAIFLGLTFGITYAFEGYIALNGGLSHPKIQLYLMGIMLIPAICTILTRLITQEGREDLWLRPEFKKNYKTMLIAWFAPGLLILLGAALFFLIFPQKFDPQMGVLRDSIRLLDPNGGEIEHSKLILTVVMQYISAILLGPIVNFFPSLGEELGWRGYLLPKLSRVTNRKKAILISGVIWGLWHAPLIAMGYNYGVDYAGFPYWGILAMTLFCVFSGSFLSWLTFKSGSVIPATLAHGGINGMSAAGVIFMQKDGLEPFLGPYPIGLIGGIGLVIVGIFCYLKINATSEKSETI